MKAKNLDEVNEFVKTMKFQGKVFGGVNEEDVWRKIELLQEEYESAYLVQREELGCLVRERDAIISLLKKQLREARVANANRSNARGR